MAQEENPNHLIQSYYLNKYFVSTLYRRASTPEEYYYYETCVFDWDKTTRKTGDMVSIENSGAFPDTALAGHFDIIQKLK